MKKLLALAMLLVLCTVLTGLLTGCKVSVANTMMTDDTPKVTVTSPDVPVISTEWTERQYTVSEQDETYKVTSAFHYAEELVNMIQIANEDETPE